MGWGPISQAGHSEFSSSCVSGTLLRLVRGEGEGKQSQLTEAFKMKRFRVLTPHDTAIPSSRLWYWWRARCIRQRERIQNPKYTHISTVQKFCLFLCWNIAFCPCHFLWSPLYPPIDVINMLLFSPKVFCCCYVFIFNSNPSRILGVRVWCEVQIQVSSSYQELMLMAFLK